MYKQLTKSLILILGIPALLLTAARMAPIGEKNEHPSQLPNQIVEELNQGFAAIPPMPLDQIGNIIANASEANYAVLFIHQGWSSTSMLGRQRYSRFLVDYHVEHPKKPTMFHYLDCTERSVDPILDLKGWESVSSDHSPLMHGNGALIWMENGAVVAERGILEFTSSSEFVDYTTFIFESAG